MRINRFITTLLCAAAVALATGCGGGSQSSSVAAPVSSVQQGTSIPYEIFPSPLALSAITEPRQVAVRDANAWKALWAEHVGSGAASRPVPEVDFTRNMVIGVFLGNRSACDGVAIVSVKQQPQRVQVTYEVSTPPPNTACIASLANPAVLVTVPLSTLPVEFVQAPVRNADLTVRSGWSFGMCIERCEGTLQVTKDGASFRISGGRNGALPAERGIWGAITEKEWETLQAGASAVPDVVIGCPDCADGGREWIEVSSGTTTKLAAFSCNTELSAASSFQSTVRTIRGRLAASLGVQDPCSPDRIAFDRLPSTVLSSGIMDKRFIAIRDANAWSAFWNEHTGGRAPLPEVSFSQRMVVGLFLGPESVPCGGLSIETVRKANDPERIEVGYRVTDPGPNVMCIAMYINQYALVTIPTSTLSVDFVKLP